MAADPSVFTRASAAYERVMVPAVFAPWARDLLDTVEVWPGARVLDVACGTGIVARLAAQRAGHAGRVVGVDVSPAMLAVARAQSDPPGLSIDWQRADAAKLPVSDAAFDIVLCQQGLQYFGAPSAALAEMKRVLAPAGRLGLSVFARSIGYEILEQTAARFIGEQAAAIVREPFALGDADRFERLIRGAGLTVLEFETKRLTAQFSVADDFIAYQLGGRLAPAVSKLGDKERAALFAALRSAFASHMSNGALTFPMDAHVAIAQR